MILDELVDLDRERLMALDILTRQKERVAKAKIDGIRYPRSFLFKEIWYGKLFCPWTRKIGSWENGHPVGKGHGKF